MKTVAVEISALANVSTTVYVDVADDASPSNDAMLAAAKLKALTGDYVWEYEGVIAEVGDVPSAWNFTRGRTVAENVE